MRIYLAGPIGDVPDNSYKTWREEISKFLKAIGYTPVNPLSKYKGKTGDFKDMLTKWRAEGKYKKVKEFMEGWVLPADRELVKNSHAIIAYVPKEIGYTIGTTREIALAYEWNKPVLVVTSIELPANSLIGMATHIFKDFNELKDYLKKDGLTKDLLERITLVKFK